MGPNHDGGEFAERHAHRRARRLMRRGDARKALQMLRESAARYQSGAAYCFLAHALIATGKQEEALGALRQALYCFRHTDQQGRARTVARWILTLDPGDRAARRRVA